MRVLVVLCVLLGVARAETKRVAVIVGNNAGNGDQPALRYAEVDAGKVSRVLVELGGVDDRDLFLLQGKDKKSLDSTLQKAAARVAEYQASGLDRVVLVFYYSGHSDGVALELGHDRFTFAALRKWLADTGADVRVGLIDSCKSGALIATKGGTPGPAFQIRLTDDLASTGEALLTSSAANEDALESKEIGGSFFTHHLVSGLRGAADASGDSRVTLTEAYQYAYKHTITTSGATLAGPQHPAYEFKMSGQGELILTELAQPTAALVVPEGMDRALIIEVARDQVIAELGRGAPTQISVAPGKYGVRAWKGEKAFEGRIVVAANSVRAVRWDELSAIELTTYRSKGESRRNLPSYYVGERRTGFAFGVGGRYAIADNLEVVGGARIGFRSRLDVSLDILTAGDDVARETQILATVAYPFRLRRDRLTVGFGPHAGFGATLQSSRTTASTGVLAVGLGATVGLRITDLVGLELQTDFDAQLLVVDGDVTVRRMPSLFLGTVITP